MTAPDESANDVRAIRAQLEKRTNTGQLPFYDLLTWEDQVPDYQLPGTARTQLLFASRQSDGEMVFALYLTGREDPSKIIGYRKGGGSDLLSRGFMCQKAWRDFRLEPPFHHMRDLNLQDKKRKAMLMAYIKACFSLRGVTRNMAYTVSDCFEKLLGRAISSLCAVERSDGITLDSAGRASQETSYLDTSPNREVLSKAPIRKASVTSTSTSQASEDNTMNFDDDNSASTSKRKLPRGASDAGHANRFGMFSAAKPRTRSQQKIMAVRQNDSRSVDIAKKRKSLGMFGDGLSAKRDKAGPRGRGRMNGEISAGNAVGTYPADLDTMDDDEELCVKGQSTAVEVRAGDERDESLTPITSSRLGLATRERYTTSSLSSLSSPPSPLYDPYELGAASIQDGGGTMNIKDGSESVGLDKQAEDYLGMEEFIDRGSARIAILEKNAQSHLSKQRISEENAQRLDQMTGTIEERLTEEGAIKKEEIRKRLEAQMAAEMATVDENISKAIALSTAKIREQRIVFAGSIEKLSRMRQEEEDKIREEQRAVTETRKKLKALKKVGGFDLGEVVTVLRQQKSRK